MRSYKFLVMQSNSSNNVMFLTADLGGSGRSANHETNVTDFRGRHDYHSYWNDAEALLIGFSRWYFRTDEKISYNMGNRLYSATNTYRFFRINEGLDDYKLAREQVNLANKDLKSFEITEEEFINNMFESWAFEQVAPLFGGNSSVRSRANPLPVEVKIVYNKEFNNWCWISDYLKGDIEQQDCLTIKNMKVTIGLDYKEAVKYISEIVNCPYRFGGNDAYNKRQELELKETK